jgi:UDP-2,4-diacetamido-2,4,6-trideoxy-beta-L-altropyranose hydrolase
VVKRLRQLSSNLASTVPSNPTSDLGSGLRSGFEMRFCDAGMMAGDNILFRCDASTPIGSGHVMRCLALAKAWQTVGGRACFLTAETIAALDARFADEGLQHERFVVESGTLEDADETAVWARRLGARWVVVDGYRFGPDYIRRLKISGVRVLVFDDHARFDFYEADVVLNQNIDAKAESYRHAASTQLLLGADYILLRPEFLVERPRKEIAAMARRLLITMGGSDSENVTSTVVRALPRLGSEFEATVVVGGGSPHYDSLRALVEELFGTVSQPKIRLVRSSANMAPLMREADVAIAAAGGTCWELAFLGVPAILITLSRDQEANAAAISRAGAALSLGWHANLSQREIGDAIRNLMNNVDSRRAMSERGQKLVDGRGAARVVEFLQSGL